MDPITSGIVFLGVAQSVETCQVMHGALNGMIAELKESHKIAEDERKRDLERIYEKLDKYGDRLPLGATLAFAGCGAAISALLTIIGFLVTA